MITAVFFSVCAAISVVARFFLTMLFIKKTDEAMTQGECDEIIVEVERVTTIQVFGDLFVMASFGYAVFMGAMSKWWLVGAGAFTILGCVVNILTIGYIKKQKKDKATKSWLEERLFNTLSNRKEN